LLSAFKQDVLKKEYETYNEVLDYCRRSANPVGRILLELFKVRDEEALKSSDKICTALQLTNFYQDTAIDIEKGRNYFPQNEMKMFNVTKKMFELKEKR
jgi:phytoene/squalene synthetase